MFLLNSRTSLVTAPCTCTHTNTSAGTPYTEGTGLICRIPSIRLLLHTLGFSPRGTCAGSGYDCYRSLLIPFLRIPGISRTSKIPAIPDFNQVLIIMILPWLMPVNTNDDLCRPNQKCQKSILCCHTYYNSKGILTFFPFPRFKL